METLQMSGIRIGAVLPNKKSWHESLLPGQIIHHLTDIMAEETPLKSIGYAQIWQEVMEHLSLSNSGWSLYRTSRDYNLPPSCVAVWNKMVVSFYFSSSMCLQCKDAAVAGKSWLRLRPKIQYALIAPRKSTQMQRHDTSLWQCSLFIWEKGNYLCESQPG